VRFVRRMVHDDLHFHAFKIHFEQEKSERDEACLVQLRNKFLDSGQVTPGVVTPLLTSGKNQFHVTVYASKQSIRYLAPKYRLYGHQSPVTVLYLICSCVLIGTCFFEDEAECTVHGSTPYTVKPR